MTLKTLFRALPVTLIATAMTCCLTVAQETAESAPAETANATATQENQTETKPEVTEAGTAQTDQSGSEKQAEQKDQNVQQPVTPKKKTAAELAREKSIAQEKIRMAKVLRNRQATKEHKAPWDGKWKQYKPYNSGASIKFPLHPKEGSTTMRPVLAEPPVELFQFMSTVIAKDMNFNFTYYDLHNPPKDKKKIQDTLNGAVAGTLARVSGEILMHETKSYGNNAGREIKYIFPLRDGKGTIAQSWARIYLIGSRLYVQQALMPQSKYDDQLARTYLDSFVVIPTKKKATQGGVKKKAPPKTLGPGGESTTPSPKGTGASVPRKK